MRESLPTSTNILQFDVTQVGQKFFRLGLIAKVGLRTPDFFSLPRRLYDAFFSNIADQVGELVKELDCIDPATLTGIEKEILNIFLDQPIPAQLSSQILETFDKLFEKDQLVAVRATIIGDESEEGEDGTSEPFAGMSESFLNVSRSNVVEMVCRCWASGFSQQAMLYRSQQGYSATGFGVAVAVQQMVDSSTSFVAFSCDPQTQSRETLIAVGQGLGELVVQEKTDIGHVRVDHRTGEISQTWAQGQRLLSDQQINLVHRAAQRLESELSHPQDVEGSFSDRGELFILQTRPVAIDQNRYRLWSSANISESFPGVTTPLTFSVAKRFYADLNRDYYRRCGVSKAALRSIDHAFDRLLGYLDGRIYHCISNFQRTTAIHPLVRFFESDYDRFVCELDRNYRRPTTTKKNSGLSSWGRIIWAAGIAFCHYFTLPFKFWRFKVWWNKQKQRVAKQTGPPCANRLCDSLDQIWNEASRQWGITLINYQQMVFFHSLAEKLLGRWCQDPQATFAELLCEGNRLLGSEVVARALEIADAIRENESLAERFVNQPADRIWQQMEAGTFDQRISSWVRNHLQQFGARGLEELKMEVPNLKDQPQEFIRVLQNYVRGNQRYSDLLERERESFRRGLWRFAKSVYFNPFKVYLVALAIRSLRKALERREVGRYMRGELFAFTKEHLFAIASELVERDYLDHQTDILFLTVDEIRDFVEGRSVTQNLRAIVELRRDEADGFECKRPIKELATYGLVSQCITQESFTTKSDERISGLGSCAGIVRGRARVVRHPRISEKFDANEILVAPETDPGWLYLMLNAKGIVVERGSLLSHTAITGRRFAIPTVVAAADACQIISDGDEIQIDGQAGTVEILKKACFRQRDQNESNDERETAESVSSR